MTRCHDEALTTVDSRAPRGDHPVRALRFALPALVFAAALGACGGDSTRVSGFGGVAPSARPTVETVLPLGTSGGAPTIILTEWKVAMVPTMRAGAFIFAITNSGTIPHELLIFESKLEPSAYPTQSSGGINEEGAGVALVSDGENIDPGGSQPRKITLKAGKYLFVCNIPGHFQQGMYTVVTLTP
jgi:uncharacterized cupredoxin-like copper-binding protein